ncbi:MAG: zinc-binding dehydrogenase [Terriglobales bacterium]
MTLFVGRGHAGLAINLGFAATDHTAGGWQRLRCANLRLRYNLQNPRGRAELILPLVPRVASGWLRFSSRAAGIKAIGTAGSDEGLQLVKKEGAHQAIKHRSADYQKLILDITNGCGVDGIIEMLANVNLDLENRCIYLYNRS